MIKNAVFIISNRVLYWGGDTFSHWIKIYKKYVVNPHKSKRLVLVEQIFLDPLSRDAVNRVST